MERGSTIVRNVDKSDILDLELKDRSEGGCETLYVRNVGLL
jgi:hypothetical protein